MAQPKTRRKGYYLDGKRLPSVTTVTSRFKDSGGLIHWAWKEGYEGRDYRDTRDKAAGIGTTIHTIVENWCRHGILPEFYVDEIVYLNDEHEVAERILEDADQDTMTKIQKALDSFRKWQDGSKFKVVASEVSLISEQHRYGGMLDSIVVHGERALGDWKTASGVYPDNLLQLAAYGILWDENNPNEPIDGGFHLMRFDRDYGDFHHHYWGELDSAKEMFLHLRAAYDLDKELKKRAS